MVRDMKLIQKEMYQTTSGKCNLISNNYVFHYIFRDAHLISKKKNALVELKYLKCKTA